MSDTVETKEEFSARRTRTLQELSKAHSAYMLGVESAALTVLTRLSTGSATRRDFAVPLQLLERTLEVLLRLGFVTAKPAIVRTHLIYSLARRGETE